ncbi:cilia- and flagella-associated protein 418 [Aulostomus maculatus]
MDDDDLEELLTEFEEKFCRNVSAASAARADTREDGNETKDGRRKRNAAHPDHSVRTITEDIDALLEELLEDGDSSSQRAQPAEPPEGLQAEKKSSSQAGGRKCCPVFLGGSAITNGVGTAASRRSCDQLRCTSCDFRVLTFDDREWDSSCDYLFFRNNMPDRQRLGAKLRRRGGVRAYACQCSWFSSSDAMDLRERPQLRWVCGKHQD